MTALPPDPEPDREDIPALDEGGGVQPGDTPPDASSMSATANKDPVVPHGAGTSGPKVWLIVTLVFTAIFLVAAVYLVFRMFDVYG
ncbi:DUF6480 family protein [Mycolicibacterium sediminis]|nr:DUF6480 family protein [Mycolicibacterium sediminis]